MKEWVWDSEDLGATWTVRDIRPDSSRKLNEMRADLVELG